jgi:hypothetical protein
MSAKNLPGGGKGWAERKADNLTTICETIFYRKGESLNVSQPHEHSRLVTWAALTFFLPFLQNVKKGIGLGRIP